MALIGVVVAAGAAGGFSADDEGASPGTNGTIGVSGLAVPATTPTPAAVITVPTTALAQKSVLDEPLGKGMGGDDVEAVQGRLKELGFDPGPIDGQFGEITRAAVWAFEKLIMQTPRSEATGIVTNDMWQRMQDPLVVVPRRPDADSDNHTEVYLPEQVVIFFQGDKAVLISHMSSGTGEKWCEEVTISPGEYGNEEGTEPLKRGECGVSTTPGGVYHYERRIEGVRQSALGGLWNPVYFNYGIAIHGALQVPLEPASHGCIRIPLPLSEYYQQLTANGDQVYVFDGVEEPEHYGAQLPIFNTRDPD
ncbi:MAG: L,D-transpeptidase family protein, partial [Actinomycetota bacterium]|nr:L,D-transpeptidase family protein [Actinomycetota bacterium]